ncbi:SWIM zinc finger family protein [Solibacillus daqui]|uniref:SWIM zinc finger family protein n=1 Tax=Solibacillus daqui TaxID=2912187 RepID=UPI0023661DB8|nr:SWIM zinc finger family protein [Solibacillus daqui]
MSSSFSDVAHSHKDFIEKTLQRFEEQLHPSANEDAELVTRAMFSVRNQAIKLRTYSAFTQILVCQIQDVRTTDVTISFTQQQISCTCPQKKLCRHQLAVIFKLSQYFISLQDWLTSWRAKKTVQLSTLASERSPESWQRMADEVLNYTFKEQRPIDSFLISSLLENARLKLQRQRPFEQEWQQLFDLYMEIACMKRLLQHAVKTGMSMDNNYFNYYLDNAFIRMERAIDIISRTTKLFAAEPFFDALQLITRDILLLEKGATHFRLALYLQFWTKLFTEKKRLTAELSILEKTNAPIDIDLNVVKALFYILLRTITPLERTIQEMSLENVESFIDVAQQSLEKGYLAEATLILKKALPFLQTFIQEQLLPIRRQKYTRKLDVLYEQIDLTEAEELTLYAAFGKFGIEAFSDYLLRHARYNEWVALHQLYPTSIAYLEQSGLKEVVAHAPEAALPLYHFYAMDEINQKSRQNYKQAVRIWRSMKSAAKKAGKLDYFENYIDAVQQQFKRLRALQEEIIKSNLIAS